MQQIEVEVAREPFARAFRRRQRIAPAALLLVVPDNRDANVPIRAGQPLRLEEIRLGIAAGEFHQRGARGVEGGDVRGVTEWAISSSRMMRGPSSRRSRSTHINLIRTPPRNAPWPEPTSLVGMTI